MRNAHFCKRLEKLSLFSVIQSILYLGYDSICSSVQTNWMLCSRGGNEGCGRNAPYFWWSKVRTIGDHPLVANRLERCCSPVLHYLDEKYWRSIPGPGGTAEDLLQRLGEKDWRSIPSRGWIGDCGPHAPASWCIRRRRQKSRQNC